MIRRKGADFGTADSGGVEEALSTGGSNVTGQLLQVVLLCNRTNDYASAAPAV